MAVQYPIASLLQPLFVNETATVQYPMPTIFLNETVAAVTEGRPNGILLGMGVKS